MDWNCIVFFVSTWSHLHHCHVGDPDAAVDAAADADEQPEEADKTLMAVEPENTMGDILEMSRGDNNMSYGPVCLREDGLPRRGYTGRKAV